MYPQWERAKGLLSKAVADAIAEKQEHRIYGIIDKWFQSHVFEFTSASKISRYEIESLKEPEEIRKHNRHYAVQHLAASLVEKHMYIRETNHVNDFYEEFSYTLLVFGVPQCGTTLGTREAAEIRRLGEKK